MGYIDVLSKAISLCPCKWGQLALSELVLWLMLGLLEKWTLFHQCLDGLKSLLVGNWAFLF